jgi:hypothetical protein
MANIQTSRGSKALAQGAFTSETRRIDEDGSRII